MAISDRLPVEITRVATDWKPGDAPLPPGVVSLEDAEAIAARQAARQAQRSNVSPNGDFATCDAKGPKGVATPPDFKALVCDRPAGHFGAHAMGETTWSAAPPLGPVPERFRPGFGGGSGGSSSGHSFAGGGSASASSASPGTGGTGSTPAGFVDPSFERLFRNRPIPGRQATTFEGPPLLDMNAPLPDDLTPEVIAAELVKCGRAIGRVDVETVVRRRWQALLRQAVGMLPPDAQLSPTEEQWAQVGRFLYDFAREEACMPQSQDEAFAQKHAGGLLGILIGMCTPLPVTLLDAAAAALRLGRTVLGAAWLAAKQARELTNEYETGTRRRVLREIERRAGRS